MTKQEVDSLKVGDVVVCNNPGDTWSIIQVTKVETINITFVVLDSNANTSWIGNVGADTREALVGSHLHLKRDIIQTTCECGAEKCGFSGHSHWCPKARVA